MDFLKKIIMRAGYNFLIILAFFLTFSVVKCLGPSGADQELLRATGFDMMTGNIQLSDTLIFKGANIPAKHEPNPNIYMIIIFLVNISVIWWILLSKKPHQPMIFGGSVLTIFLLLLVNSAHQIDWAIRENLSQNIRIEHGAGFYAMILISLIAIIDSGFQMYNDSRRNNLKIPKTPDFTGGTIAVDDTNKNTILVKNNKDSL